jgi:hypothetical protein
MTGPTGINKADMSASEHTARYETLRDHARQAPRAAVARHGLAVLLRDGMAAWLDAYLRLPPPAARATQHERQRSVLSEGTSAEVIRVLAAMAIEHIQEVYA